MALNTEHKVTLTEAQISIILYTLEDYMAKRNTSGDPDLENDVENIFEELEGSVDKYYEKVEKAKAKRPTEEW